MENLSCSVWQQVYVALMEKQQTQNFWNLQERENVNQINSYLQGNDSFVLRYVLETNVENRIRDKEEKEIIHDGELI
jgi:type IV secretory pathway component VirB8